MSPSKWTETKSSISRVNAVVVKSLFVCGFESEFMTHPGHVTDGFVPTGSLAESVWCSLILNHSEKPPVQHQDRHPLTFVDFSHHAHVWTPTLKRSKELLFIVFPGLCRLGVTAELSLFRRRSWLLLLFDAVQVKACDSEQCSPITRLSYQTRSRLTPPHFTPTVPLASACSPRASRRGG